MKSATLNVLLVFSVAIGAVGCSREDEPARTVSWFREHPEERKAMVTRCADDPGRLGQTPNCINAKQAESIEGIGHMKDLPPLGLDPNRKPGFEDDQKPKVRP
jgi:hypothetical protein